MDKASDRLSFQGERQYDRFVTEVTKQLDQFMSWNNIPCCSSLVHRGAALQAQEFEYLCNYKYIRASRDTFLVIYMKSKRKKDESPVSQWGNICTIQVLQSNHWVCFCSMYQRDGLVCRHILMLYNLVKYQISHHDTVLRWWLVHAVYSHTQDNTNEVCNLLHKLQQRKKQGPL